MSVRDLILRMQACKAILTAREINLFEFMQLPKNPPPTPETPPPNNFKKSEIEKLVKGLKNVK